MIRRLIYSAILCILLPLHLAAEVKLAVHANRNQIFLGESFNLTLEINGADEKIKAPSFSTSAPAEITLIDSRSNNRSSIQIINGQVTRDVFRGRVLTYMIKPSAAGTFRTGAISIEINGKAYRHQGVTVQVKGIEKQETVIVTVNASSTAVLVEEPFNITMEIAIKELPEPLSREIEPIHAESLPHISADFLEITDEKDALIRPDLNSILSSMIDQSGRKPAFRINNYMSRGFGSFFDGDPFRERPLRFLLNQESVVINDIRYRKYSLTLNYTATAEGEHTFGPVTFKGRVITDVNDARQADIKEIYTIGAAVTVRVTPPPDEGRPEEFIGSVGRNINVSAQLDTNVCKIGDPLTLTLEITGDISVSNMRTPILNLQPELTENFRIYDDNVKTETLKNGKRFLYRVRPTAAGTLEFPPVKIAYFDSAERKYKTILTAALPLQAEYTAQVSTGKDASGGVVEVKMALPHPSGISVSAAGLTKEPLLPSVRLMLILLLTAPLIAVVVLLTPALRDLKNSVASGRRHSGATARSIKRIKGAQNADELAATLRDWFSQRLDVAGQALTERDVLNLLSARNVPQQSCEQMASILTLLDATIYRPAATSELPKKECIELLAKIENALRTRKKSGCSAITLLVLTLMSIAQNGKATESANSAERFLWEQANAQMTQAVEAHDYLKAAETYQRLLREDIVNPTLLNNLGCALTMGGDFKNAQSAFERAERFSGVTVETSAGLNAALARARGASDAATPWYRTAFFWHFGLPARVRAFAALVGWNMLWLGALLFIMRKRIGNTTISSLLSLAETLIFTGALLVLLFGSSTIFSVVQEQHDRSKWKTLQFSSNVITEEL